MIANAVDSPVSAPAPELGFCRRTDTDNFFHKPRPKGDVPAKDQGVELSSTRQRHARKGRAILRPGQHVTRNAQQEKGRRQINIAHTSQKNQAVIAAPSQAMRFLCLCHDPQRGTESLSGIVAHRQKNGVESLTSTPQGF